MSDQEFRRNTSGRNAGGTDRNNADRRPVRRDVDEAGRQTSRARRDPDAVRRSSDAPRRSADSRPRQGSGKRRKKKNSKKTIILLVIEVIVLLVLAFIAYTLFVKMNVTKVGKVELNETAISDSINSGVAENQTMTGYTNIALFGVDARDGRLDKKTRSDSIIIASINNETKEVKLVSVYRDTYLNLSNDEYNKCNAAYASGGPEQAISMLNMNLDMDIHDSITIGFKGLSDVVDKLGGVEIEVTDAEITHLNNYQSTMAQEMGISYTPVTSAGMQTLNGLQATAYCRIRYTAGDDFRRAERQRTVLMACLDKAKGKDISTLEEVASSIFEETYTTLDLSDIVTLLGDVPNYNVVANDGFPNADMRSTGTMGKKGSCVLPQDLASNVKWLHQFLFNDDSYEVTSDVQGYSDKIASDINSLLD